MSSEDKLKAKIEAQLEGARGGGLRSSMRRWVDPQTLKTLQLGGLFGLWYLFNIYFNIYNKRALNNFPFPVTATLVHLGVASLLMVVLWGLRLQKRPQLSGQVVWQLLPLGVLHAFGFTTTNTSLGSVNVSFTHTIKAMEPFFTVILSTIFLGYIPSLPIMLTLTPIVGGVILASVSELSFTWIGFINAMASNLCFQSRNVLSKRYMTQASYSSLEASGTEVLDQTNLFACITILATLLLLPYWAYVDGATVASGAAAAAAKVPIGQITWWCVAAGLCRFGDVLTSYALLAKVIPVTHSVGNCVKRVVVIAASVVVFKTPMTGMNLFGTGMALTGVFLYSAVKNATESKVSAGRASAKTAFELQPLAWWNSLVAPLLKVLGAKGKKEEGDYKKTDKKEDEPPEYNL